MDWVIDKGALDSWARGEEMGVRAVWDLAGPTLLRYATAMTGDPAAAEELVQETMLRAHAARSRLESASGLMPWLLTIAGNLSRNYLRDRGRRREEPLRDGPAGATPERDQPWAAAARSERQALVRLAVAGLPVPQREILVLRELGWTCREGAALLGIPEGTAKSRYRAALASLAAALASLADRPPPAPSPDACPRPPVADRAAD